MGGVGLARPAGRIAGRLAAGMADKPFRPFFMLAAFDAVLGAAIWLPWAAAAAEAAGILVGQGHRSWLLFAFVPAMLSGFVLTALPRWTGRRVSPRAVRMLFSLSLVARVGLVLVPAFGLLLASACVLFLGLLASRQVIAGGDRRNLKLVALLFVLSASAAAISLDAAFALDAGLAQRTALAAIVGLMLIVGGRVVPALTASFADHGGTALRIRCSPPLERLAAAAAAFALAAWSCFPQSEATAALSAAAAVLQFLRLAQWRGWRARASSVLALHLGYAWIVAGFALLAAHWAAPTGVPRAAFLHGWTVGGIGTMGLAIMASMVRRHGRRPFLRSRLAAASFLAVTLSALLRQFSEYDRPEVWIPLSAACWVAAFLLFVAASASIELDRLGGGGPPDRQVTPR